MQEPSVIGTIIKGVYEIEDVIGSGAFSFVYRVKDHLHPETTWAMKELSSSLEEHEGAEEAFEQFIREGELLKALNHPSLPKVVDVFGEGKKHYIVMEYVEGQNLQRKLKEKGSAFSFDEILPWMLQLLDILSYLHSLEPPVVFRDLKPSNIMITAGGRIKLIDFGIARLFSPEKVKDTYVMGTPGFSAPEQYGRAQTDPRSDIYALGATIFYLLTGDDPEQYVFKDFPPLDRSAAQVPSWFSAAVMRCLERKPEKRFQTALEVKHKLERHRVSAASSAFSQQPAKPAMSQSAVDASLIAISALTFLSILMFIVVIRSHWFGRGSGAVEFMVIMFMMGITWFTAIGLLKTPQGKAGFARFIIYTVLATPFIMASCIPLRVQYNLHHDGLQSQCCKNLRVMADAVQKYSADHRGSPPQSLSELIPQYLGTIPSCPSAGSDTYTSSYSVQPDGKEYLFFCKGENHTHARFNYADYPRYDSKKGLCQYPMR
ncbi:MAG: serine/threonine protein kinase [Candidatus Xenobiia bacterium LiM19]